MCTALTATISSLLASADKLKALMFSFSLRLKRLRELGRRTSQRQTDRQTDKQTDRQTDRQAERELACGKQGAVTAGSEEQSVWLAQGLSPGMDTFLSQRDSAHCVQAA